RGLVDRTQAVLLTLPILEMAAYDMNIALPEAVLRTASTAGPEFQQGLRDSADLLASTIWSPAGGLGDLYVTRVVTRATAVGSSRLEIGDRVVVDIGAANATLGQAQVGDHLAF